MAYNVVMYYVHLQKSCLFNSHKSEVYASKCWALKTIVVFDMLHKESEFERAGTEPFPLGFACMFYHTPRSMKNSQVCYLQVQYTQQ